MMLVVSLYVLSLLSFVNLWIWKLLAGLINIFLDWRISTIISKLSRTFFNFFRNIESMIKNTIWTIDELMIFPQLKKIFIYLIKKSTSIKKKKRRKSDNFQDTVRFVSEWLKLENCNFTQRCKTYLSNFISYNHSRVPYIFRFSVFLNRKFSSQKAKNLISSLFKKNWH